MKRCVALTIIEKINDEVVRIDHATRKIITVRNASRILSGLDIRAVRARIA